MTDELDLVRQLRPNSRGPSSDLVARERNALIKIAQAPNQRDDSANARHGRSNGRLWAIPAVVLVAGATAAAGYAVLNDEVSTAAAFTCEAEGVTTILPNDGTSPVEACAQVRISDGIDSDIADAPPLVACVSSRGVVTVIERKGEDACKDADMAPWTDEGDFKAVGAAVRTVLIRFHDRFKATGGLDGEGNGCAEEAEWRTELGSELTRAGLTAWKIDANQVEEGRHCYGSPGIDPRTRTIVLIGHPGDYSIDCDPRTGC